jgi:hypothetical protein
MQRAGRVMQARFVILILALEMLRPQEQAFSPQDFRCHAHVDSP